MPTRPPAHRPAGLPTAAERRREVDRNRGTTAQRGYGSHWQRLRKVILASEPLCRSCGVIAEEVDNIDGDSRNNDPANLRPLCKPCHSRRTARDQGFARSSSHGPA